MNFTKQFLALLSAKKLQVDLGYPYVNPEEETNTIIDQGRQNFKENNNLSEAITNEYILYKNILYLLEEDKIFLQPDMSLGILADKLKTNITYVSQIFNTRFGNNFNNVINHYRVEYCKEYICNNTDKVLVIKELCFSAGFSSQSTFFNAFKTEVGFTPLQYYKLAQGHLDKIVKVV